jgi:hypothetical protein
MLEQPRGEEKKKRKRKGKKKKQENFKNAFSKPWRKRQMQCRNNR